MATIDYPTLLPVCAPEEKWLTLANGGDGDDYSFHNGLVSHTSDGVPEISIYPGDWDGADLPPGNFGLVQLGPFVGGSVVRNQIDRGPTQSDLDFYGGELAKGMSLSGITGMESSNQVAFTGGVACAAAEPAERGSPTFRPSVPNS